MTSQSPSNESSGTAYERNDTLSDRIIESLNQPLAVLDESLRLFRFNRQFREFFGIEADSGAPRPLKDVFQDDRLEDAVRNALSSGGTSEVEFSCSDGDGHERQFLLAISRISAPELGEGSLVIFDEITEWKMRQHQVMEASRLVSIGEMAAGIAHEINNPLAAAMGFAQLVLRKDMDNIVREDVGKILAEAKRAAKIISNLQSFARRFKPIKAPVDVTQLVQKVLDFRAYELEVNNIEVVTKFDPDLPLIEADQQQMEQVFLNLVVNAEQFMSVANSGGTLTIAITKSNGNVRLTFADDGPGITPENISRVFDPFFTTREVGGGTGLGLSVCYGMVHEHAGTITVDSVPGEGATFILLLPAMAEAARPSPQWPDASGALHMSILIVDDEPAVAEFLSRALEELGHSVDVASNGDEAIRDRRLDSYDLVVLDVKMPGTGGVAVYNHIDNMKGGNVPEVLFVTGDATNAATRQFIDESGSALLAKPFTLEELGSCVARVAMHRRRARNSK